MPTGTYFMKILLIETPPVNCVVVTSMIATRSYTSRIVEVTYTIYLLHTSSGKGKIEAGENPPPLSATLVSLWLRRTGRGNDNEEARLCW